MANNNQDWEALGRNIQEIIDQAVNSQDYRKLNQTITRTVNRAVDVGGETVKHHLDEHPEDASRICREIGRNIAMMHNAGIAHGDLNTSNMIIAGDGRICIIDFSMGASLVETEDMGVDIRLLERAFSSAHPKLGEAYKELIGSYCETKTCPDQVMDKVQEIKDRGRYT